MQEIIVVHINNGEKNPESENREHLMLREIEEEVERLERISAEITMRHAILSQLRNSIREILELSEKPDKIGTQAGPKTSPTVGNEPPTVDTPTPTREPETPNLTENEQLEMLERGLRYAVGVLENTKMAYYFKTIKQLREDR